MHYFFTKKYANNNINLPDINMAKYFSIETIFNEESFGIHKPWKYLKKEEYNKLITDSPEVYELELLNNEQIYTVNVNNSKINFIEEIIN